ncbi:MAG: LamG-like jellyroll fold domain-containing protein [Bacteroidota bacterium]
MSKKLHLKLDAIENDQVLDLSGNGFHGTVISGATIVEDDTFGTCLEFDGSTGNIALPSSETVGLTNNSFSISAWVCPYETGPRKTILGSAGTTSYTGLQVTIHNGSPHLGFVSSGTVATPTVLATDEWYYVTWIYNLDTLEQTIYIDGDNKFVGSNKPGYTGTSDLKLGNWNGNYFSGKVYGLRIYDEVLSQADIQYAMREDQGWPSARATHPIDFDLSDEDHQNVLYITETSDQVLRLDISNASTNSIYLADLTAAPVSSLNHHFALRFRPGTLSETSLDTTGSAPMQLNADSGGDWQMAGPTTDASGMDVIYLRSNAGGLTMDPDAIQSILFDNVGADGTQGARGTRVELQCANLAYSDALTEEIVTTRELHLSVVNQRGQKNIPLHVGFIGDNGVLNTDESMDLTLRISNAQQYDGIHSDTAALKFIYDAEEDARSAMTLTFATSADKDDEWALIAPTDISHVEFTVYREKNDKGELQSLSGWEVIKSTDTNNPEWIIYPTSDQALYSEDDPAGSSFINVAITGIKTKFPIGHTYLTVDYKNIPNYWDGQMKVAIEKRPLIYAEGAVGIGIQDPKTVVAIRKSSDHNPVGIAQDHGNGGGNSTMELTTMDSSENQATRLLLRGNSDTADVEFRSGAFGAEEVTMFIEGSSGNVGIGTEAPTTRLEISELQDTSETQRRGPGLTISTKNTDDVQWELGRIGGVVGNLTDRTGYPGGLAFYTKAGNGNTNTDSTERMRLDYQGYLGIGTQNPETPIAIQKSSSHDPVGITQEHGNGAGKSTMEFTTMDNSGNQATRILLRGNTDTADVEFRTGPHGSEEVTMFIEGTDGFVGIGTDDPSERLHVNGSLRIANTYRQLVVPEFGIDDFSNTVLAAYIDGRGVGSQLRFQGVSNGSFVDIGNNSAGGFVIEMSDYVKFSINQAGRVDIPGSLYINNRVVTGSPFSDERLKQDAAPIESALDKVLALNGVTYKWNEAGVNTIFGEPTDAMTPEQEAMRTAELERNQIGLMAQAVEAVVPEVVTEGEQGYKTVAYSQLVALLVEAIKEQNETIQALSDRLDAMG